MGSVLQSVLLLFCLIIIGACFSCAEISFLTVNRNRLDSLAQKGNRKAKRLLSLLKEPAKFLATIQVGNTLTGFLASAFAADIFSRKLTEFIHSLGINLPYATLNAVSVVVIILVLSYFTMVLSELVPKRVAMKKADTLAFLFSGPLLVISKIFSPLVWLLTRSTNSMLRVFGIDPKTAEKAVTEEEIRMMIDLGRVGGAIKKNEQEILQNVFEFDNKNAGEVMTHRMDVVFLNLNETDAEWERVIAESRRNLFPVCGAGPDDVKGILSARDYFILKSGTSGDRFREVLMKNLRPARFVPQSVKTDRLFRQMKKSRNHFAVVVDEYGSMTGIVTMNDLLEELVGDLEDDVTVPADRPLIESAGKNRWRIGGAASLDAIARELGIAMPVEQYDTFSGFVFSLLGHIPEDGAGEELEYIASGSAGSTESGDRTACKLLISMLDIKEHRLENSLVQKIQIKG